MTVCISFSTLLGITLLNEVCGFVLICYNQWRMSGNAFMLFFSNFCFLTVFGCQQCNHKDNNNGEKKSLFLNKTFLICHIICYATDIHIPVVFYTVILGNTEKSTLNSFCSYGKKNTIYVFIFGNNNASDSPLL